MSASWFDSRLPSEIRDDPRLRRRGRLIVASSLGLAAAILVGLGVRLTLGPMPGLVLGAYGSAIPVLLLVPRILKWSGSLYLAGAIATYVLLFATLTGVVFGGGPDGSGMVMLPLVPLFATYLIGVRAGLRMTVLLATAVALMVVAVHLGVAFPELPLGTESMTKTRGIVAFVALSLTGGFAINAEKERRAAEDAHFRSHDLYRRLFEQSKDIVALATPDGEWLDIN